MHRAVEEGVGAQRTIHALGGDHGAPVCNLEQVDLVLHVVRAWLVRLDAARADPDFESRADSAALPLLVVGVLSFAHSVVHGGARLDQVRVTRHRAVHETHAVPAAPRAQDELEGYSEGRPANIGHIQHQSADTHLGCELKDP